jgi:glycosyltransferase involved in cell wall biosynthesis
MEHRLKSLLNTGAVDLCVIAPVPWFPLSHKAFGSYGEYARIPFFDQRNQIEVRYPRFPIIPKIGMSASPFLMACGLYNSVSTLARSFNFDVIDAYYLYPDGVAAAILARAFNRPLLLTALGSDVSLLPTYQVPKKLILWGATRAFCLTTVCCALRDELVRLGIPTERIRVIKHGVDLNLFRPLDDRAMVRASLGLTKPTIVSVGRLVKEKGHDVAIQAMKFEPGMELLVIGEGPEKDRLSNLIHTEGLSDRVRLCGGLDQRALSTMLGAADCLLQCSSREGISNVILESLACGTPVAATAVWGTPETMNSVAAGVLFEDRTPAGAANAIAKLFRNPPGRRETRRFAEQFTWTETANQHLAALENSVYGVRCDRVIEQEIGEVM